LNLISTSVVVASEEGKSRLAEIFTRERARFLRFVRRQVNELSSADAEDLLSDVTYKLLSRADVVDQVENLTAYIYRSVANRVVDQRRRSVPVVQLTMKMVQKSHISSLKTKGLVPIAVSNRAGFDGACMRLSAR
jgi:DNA-directed RNA polymerase specialized sigma24 family protein